MQGAGGAPLRTGREAEWPRLRLRSGAPLSPRAPETVRGLGGAAFFLGGSGRRGRARRFPGWQRRVLAVGTPARVRR